LLEENIILSFDSGSVLEVENGEMALCLVLLSLHATPKKSFDLTGEFYQVKFVPTCFGTITLSLRVPMFLN